VIEGGGKVRAGNASVRPDKGETRSMRSKEEANDYRYFPDPDLLPVVIDEVFIEKCEPRAAGAAGPESRALRQQHGLSSTTPAR
jgi:aspartyl-tRNA(Asn)/glutamyl-tRNA(Gln) amidotransferase subunit B